ncbi:MAG: hypothetical protein CM1200mP39_24750 [Dehalococcoidia bacterium]|nr:MAG: hypothetical protein CM1200mP39_24750 [Dehalococcoidia bacterium]
MAHIRVHDKDGFEKFKEMAGPTISDYGGKNSRPQPSPEIRKVVIQVSRSLLNLKVSKVLEPFMNPIDTQKRKRYVS